MNGKPYRLAYIDWLRGLACVAMFQTHCYDAWLAKPARGGKFFWYSQFMGSLPAPLFLFLAGISCAFVADRMWQKGVAPAQISRTAIRRGAEVFSFGLLFRLQEFLLGYPGAPWTDLLRVDVLNVIGISIVFIGVLIRLAALAEEPSPVTPASLDASAARFRRRGMILSIAVAAAIMLATPPLWTTYRPRWLPWYLESYVNGVHIFDRPQPWLFPIFPWTAFAFVGLAAGFALGSPWARRNELRAVAYAGAAGLFWFAFSRVLMALPHFYSVYDFWHTSPEFFLARVGVLLLLVPLSYAWCRWGAGQKGLRPVINLGQASLLVYWVHIEFVYGRFSILKKGGQTLASATAGLMIIFVAMVALAAARNRTRGRGMAALRFWRAPSQATA